MAKENNTNSIEEEIKMLETIIEALEKPESTLDISLDLYKKGTAKIEACRKMIEAVESEIKTIEKKDV